MHALKYEQRVFGTQAGRPAPAPTPAFEPPAAASRPLRADTLAALDARIAAGMREAPERVLAAEDERPTPWFEHALVPALAARFGGAPYLGFGNLPNAGHLVEAPAGQIVEVELRLSGRHLETRSPGPLPEQVRPLFERVAEADRLGLRAALTRDARLLAAAMAALPHALTDAARGALVMAAMQPFDPQGAPEPPATAGAP
ncbi:MAG: hypothetical protein FJ090_23125 [Deltaproteobacteria bacterium]|nr:hypothetical protein [Deltaproteobacteria bacterium]